MTHILQDKVNNLPKSPGVYLFKNIYSKIIYVGKAVNLKYRVGSYFVKKHSPNSKTKLLVSNINDIEFIPTQSEIEALILEAELIKKYKPKFNILLKDDKSYLFIVIRPEEVKNINNISKVLTVRKPDLQSTDIVFGPYPDGTTAKDLVRAVRKIFPFRDCSISKFNKHHKLNTPCLYGHIGLCSSPCLQESSIIEYRKTILRLKHFLEGKGETIYRNYTNYMKRASQELNYEKAAYYRDLLTKIDYVRSNFRSAQSYIDNPNLLYDTQKKSVEQIKSNISILATAPNKIECYDISNISGKEAVGSMVVAVDGKIEKSLYKKFRVKTKQEPDDFYMMGEVLRRRLERGINTENEEWALPNLIVVDGGKGQVSTTIKIMQKLNINIPIVGIAKKNEELIYISDGSFVVKKLPMSDLGLKLIINLRNEAHRFAKKYHTSLRLKKIKV